MSKRRHVDDSTGGALLEQINESHGEKEVPHVVGCEDDVETFWGTTVSSPTDSWTKMNDNTEAW